MIGTLNGKLNVIDAVKCILNQGKESVMFTLQNVHFRRKNTISLMFTACRFVYESTSIDMRVLYLYESLAPFRHYPQMSTKTICLRLHRPKLNSLETTIHLSGTSVFGIFRKQFTLLSALSSCKLLVNI